MNLAHLHLLITHLPIFGTILGALVLFYGIRAKSFETKAAAHIVFIISALGGFVAYITGEDAEEAAEEMSGVLKSNIHRHEDFASLAIVSLSILGVVSIIALFITLKRYKLTNIFAKITLVIALFSFGLAARTGYLGGLIRHTEITVDQNNNDDDD